MFRRCCSFDDVPSMIFSRRPPGVAFPIRRNNSKTPPLRHHPRAIKLSCLHRRASNDAPLSTRLLRHATFDAPPSTRHFRRAFFDTPPSTRLHMTRLQRRVSNRESYFEVSLKFILFLFVSRFLDLNSYQINRHEYKKTFHFQIDAIHLARKQNNTFFSFSVYFSSSASAASDRFGLGISNSALISQRGQCEGIGIVNQACY
jgi:hypothetical protein